MQTDWDVQTWTELPETPNNYIHIDLPPFDHEPKYISHIKEHWVVKSKGRNPRYLGCYRTLEEAEKVRMIYDGRVYHQNERWRVLRTINGKRTSYGSYPTREDAVERVRELEKGGWIK